MSIASPWEMETRKGGGNGSGSQETCPAGNHPGTVVGLFDVGNQPTVDNEGKPVEYRQLVLVFELMKKDSAGKPFCMAVRYRWSMHEKSTFYAIACNLTGRKFSDGEKLDPRTLVGLPCMVQVTNTDPNDKGRVYANVKAVTSYPEGFPAIEPSRAPTVWSVMEGKPLPDTTWVPYVYGKSISDLVQMSAEHRSGKVPIAAAGTATNAGPSSESDDDETPF